jgi:formate dehydrogenase maturation protein FdhE
MDDTKDRRWGIHDFSEMLAGMMDPATLRQADARGMTPAYAASLHAAEKANLLMALLDMAADHEGESSLDRIENLLGEMVEQQKVTNERLNALVLLFSSRANREAAWNEAKQLADETVPPLKAKGRRKSEPDGSGD